MNPWITRTFWAGVIGIVVVFGLSIREAVVHPPEKPNVTFEGPVPALPNQ